MNADQEKVLGVIREGYVTFRRINYQLGYRYFDNEFRKTDRALQSLRRKGLIRFVKGRWEIVEEERV